MIRFAQAVAFVVLILTMGGAGAAETADYVREEVMIPMRDGIRLHAEIWRPRQSSNPLPILMQRSPYGFAPDRVSRSFENEYKELAREGFIFVLEDIRGRFGSEGAFVMLRPKAAPGGVDESTDSYDSIDWLIGHVPGNNGKVGIFGVSYLGWTTAMATIDPHPALKAVSVQASPEDMYLGDDFHHNGAFRLDYGWEYAAALESDGHTFQPFDFAGQDPYDWYLKQGSLAELDKRSLGRTLPTWQNFVRHPDYDSFWQAGVTSSQMPHPVAVPDLIVAGWWDQEDFYGPLTIFAQQARDDPQNLTRLVIGPWNHGGWARGPGDSYGPFAFGSETSVYFRAQVETPWFRYWLKGEGSLDDFKALVFETGSNQWRRLDDWPACRGVERRRLYLHAGGKLSFDPPGKTEAKADRFRSDPARPVPYRPRPISAMTAEDSTWRMWLADDQAPFAKRPDVLVWQTEPLTEEIVLRGDVAAELFASTTGTDADWIVKLIDADPSGRQSLIANEVFRGRYRQGFEHPQPLEAGKVLDYAIDLHSAAHVFQKGHRIAIQIQSSWFPLIDRNPQTFQPNIFQAPPSSFKAQTHSVFHTPAYPSAIAIDIAQP